jgi:hypothetical protein
MHSVTSGDASSHSRWLAPSTVVPWLEFAGEACRLALSLSRWMETASLCDRFSSLIGLILRVATVSSQHNSPHSKATQVERIVLVVAAYGTKPPSGFVPCFLDQ